MPKPWDQHANLCAHIAQNTQTLGSAYQYRAICAHIVPNVQPCDQHANTVRSVHTLPKPCDQHANTVRCVHTLSKNAQTLSTYVQTLSKGLFKRSTCSCMPQPANCAGHGGVRVQRSGVSQGQRKPAVSLNSSRAVITLCRLPCSVSQFDVLYAAHWIVSSSDLKSCKTVIIIIITI